MPDRVVPFVRGMKVGLGFDRLVGEPITPGAVVGSSVTAPAGAGGQLVTSDCIIVADVETLHKAVGVTVDGGGSYMGFSGSAKVDYLNSCDFSTFSVYVLVAVSARNAFESIDSPVFVDDANELIRTNNKDRFKQRFGDCFITGIQTGGELFAIYQVTGTSQSEKEDTATDVKLAFGDATLGANLHTKIETAVARSSSHLEVQCFVFRAGEISKADLNAEDVMQTARDFPVAVAGDKGIAFEVTLESYNRLRSPTDGFSFIDIQNQQDVLADLAAKRFQFLRLRDNYAYILSHFNDFTKSKPDGAPLNRDEVIKAHDQVVAQINTMQNEASACAKDATKCTFSPFDISLFDVPVLAEAPLASQAANGLAIARQDPLAMAIRALLPGLQQRGFDLGMAIADGQTLLGPGKQAFIDSLPTDDEKRGCALAVRFSVDRNRNAAAARSGQAVAQANPSVEQARDSEPAGLFTLGFDIASGIFGDPAHGALGHTSEGPGAHAIMLGLSDDSQRGYVESRDLNLKLRLKP